MPREPKIVAVRAGRYLTVSGKGSPNDEEFQRKRVVDGSRDLQLSRARVELKAKVRPTDGLHFRGRHHEIYLSDPRRVRVQTA